MTPRADVALAPFSTMGVGGPARWFAEARSEDDVCAALAWASARSSAVYVLGGGSNVVIADRGLDGLVMRVVIDGLDRRVDDGRASYTVGAGMSWDAFVGTTVAAGDAGLECLSGIPGFAGGTPIQNVGAYGQEVSATIRHVRAVDRGRHRPVSFSNAECRFGYRTSRFKRDDFDRYVVTHVEFSLEREGSPTIAYADVVKHFERRGESSPSLAAVREAVLAIRRTKGMVIEPGNPANRSCGSFFVNPVVPRQELRATESVAGQAVPHFDVDEATVKIPAAWLIERAGFPKGTTRRSVRISPYQAQAIVCDAGASASDVVALATEIKLAVHTYFGITLMPEPVLLGFKEEELATLMDRSQCPHS